MGPPRASNSNRNKVPISAFCESRLSAETSNPAASEKNNALTSASALFQNWAPVIPPITSVTARIGSTASSA